MKQFLSILFFMNLLFSLKDQRKLFLPYGGLGFNPLLGGLGSPFGLYSPYNAFAATPWNRAATQLPYVSNAIGNYSPYAYGLYGGLGGLGGLNGGLGLYGGLGMLGPFGLGGMGMGMYGMGMGMGMYGMGMGMPYGMGMGMPYGMPPAGNQNSNINQQQQPNQNANVDNKQNEDATKLAKERKLSQKEKKSFNQINSLLDKTFATLSKNEKNNE